MPELYGHPFKYELRAEINELNSRLMKETAERRLAQNRLVCARARIRELEARIQAIEQKIKDVGALAAQPIQINCYEELEKERKRRWAEIDKAATNVAA